MRNVKNVIYIMTNPSFPQFVKIGYADDADERLKQLNRSECIPYAFRIYATFKTPNRLSDKKLHKIIDNINPNLRIVDTFAGKKRQREFYELTPEKAFSILEAIAQFYDAENNLELFEPTNAENEAQENAEITTAKIKKRKLPGIDWLIKQGVIHVKDQIYVINHHDKIATVINGNSVLFNGKEMSYQQFGCLVTGWKAIQTCAWMKIVGNDSKLSELRDKKMKELGI